MEFAAIILISFAITALFIPVTIKLAFKYGLVDNPKLRPHPAHLHTSIIPRAGGLAIYTGILISSLFFLPVEKHLIGILAGATILLITGIFDDKLIKFNPYFRLALIFLAASLPVAFGVGISFITNPFSQLPFLPPFLNQQIIRLDQIIIFFNFLGPHKLILLADIFALFWIAIITQIINWSKGVDGQMPAITLISSLTLAFLSLKFYYQGDTNQLNVAKLGFITAGVSLGFLIFNWHPAKIFPGFSGSTILAYILAVLSILSGAKVTTALLVLAIPTIDFVYTFWRRALSGHSPVWGDRGHLHHKLLDLGWSHQSISLFYMAGSAILGATALLLDTKSKIFAALLVVVLFFGFILWLNSFYEHKQ